MHLQLSHQCCDNFITITLLVVIVIIVVKEEVIVVIGTAITIIIAIVPREFAIIVVGIVDLKCSTAEPTIITAAVSQSLNELVRIIESIS